jgi:paraquat-inducible protein A
MNRFSLLGLYALWLLSTVLLLVGISIPMLTMTQLLIIDNQFSVISGIVTLWQQQHYGLFVIVGLFSLVVPILKLGLLFLLIKPSHGSQTIQTRLLKLMHDFGRWAMLDVMVVAMLIVSVKLGPLASITVHAGLYIFASAILLTMWLTHFVVKQHA